MRREITAQRPVEVTKQNADDASDKLRELLDELRVILPGTQVLFAFLLAVPFSTRFTEIRSAEQISYFIAFIAATVASILLIAPGALHRIAGHRTNLEKLIETSTRLAIAGTVFLAVSIAAVVFLITHFLHGAGLAAVVTAGAVCLTTWLWYGLPITSRK